MPMMKNNDSATFVSTNPVGIDRAKLQMILVTENHICGVIFSSL